MPFFQQEYFSKFFSIHPPPPAQVYPVPQIYTGDPRPPISPYVMASSAMELKLEAFRFFPTTHTKKPTKPMRRRSSRTVQHFTRVYLHAQTYTPDKSLLFWSQGKPEYPQFRPHTRIRMAQVLGSSLYICGQHTDTKMQPTILQRNKTPLRIVYDEIGKES